MSVGNSAKLSTYKALVESLLNQMQSQLLNLIKLHGIDKLWVAKFTSTYSKMANFELKHTADLNYTSSCKDLYSHLTRNIASQQSSRTNSTSMNSSTVKGRAKSIHSHVHLNPANYSIPSPSYYQKKVVSTPVSSDYKKQPINTYYSKLMNSFLNSRQPIKLSRKNKARTGGSSDFWVLGDDIKYIH